MASGPITSWQIDGETMETVADYFLGLQNHFRWWLQPWNLKMPAHWKKSYGKPKQCIKKQRHYFTNKVHIVKAMVFPVVMNGCESWTIKKAEHWRTDAFELWCQRKTLESPLDCKEIKPVNPKGNKSWKFTGGTDAEAEALILWPSDVKSRLIRKDPDAGKNWEQKKKERTEDEMVGWHHQLNERKFEQAPGNGEGQGSLACCSLWCLKESDTTELLNNNNTVSTEKTQWICKHGNY